MPGLRKVHDDSRVALWTAAPSVAVLSNAQGVWTALFKGGDVDSASDPNGFAAADKKLTAEGGRILVVPAGRNVELVFASDKDGAGGGEVTIKPFRAAAYWPGVPGVGDDVENVPLIWQNVEGFGATVTLTPTDSGAGGTVKLSVRSGDNLVYYDDDGTTYYLSDPYVFSTLGCRYVAVVVTGITVDSEGIVMARVF